MYIICLNLNNEISKTNEGEIKAHQHLLVIFWDYKMIGSHVQRCFFFSLTSADDKYFTTHSFGLLHGHVP